VAGLSSPGIGSNLDVNGIVSKLMAVESQPVTLLQQKEASYKSTLSSFGALSSALSTFQSAVNALNSPAKFRNLTATPADTSILGATADSSAIPGNYTVNVIALAQAQSIVSGGLASTSAPVGAGGSTTLTFQFGSINGGSYIKNGSNLSSTVATSGIAAGSLVINGMAVATNASTTSAKALAAKINLLSGTTGVTATAQATDTGTLAFSDVTTDVGDSYTLTMGGTTLANIGGSTTFTKADLDSAVSANLAALAADGITVSGTAVGGDLHFTRADGSNIAITQTLVNTSNNASGGFAGLTSGTTTNYTSSVSLSSDNAITVSGSNPSAAGLSAGNGIYDGATFTQDASRGTGTVTIDSTNNSLQGIRDAINKADIGVTASIVSDGSSSPYHLVLTSTKAGSTSAMKIDVAGDASLQGLLSYDPSSSTGQQMTETSSAQDSQVTVNGIAISSSTTTIDGAIQGVTINALKTGTTTLSIARDTSSIATAVNGFVKAYNDLNTTLKQLTAYDPDSKQAGPLIGDPTVNSIQAGMRSLLSNVVTGANGNVKTLSDIGVTFQRDGSLQVDSSKLQTAINNNFSGIGSLFAAMGESTDSLVSVADSTTATQPGTYAVNVTQLATQGSLVGNVDVRTGSTMIASGTEISVTLDGTTSLVKLPAGTYTSSKLAAMLQSAINGTSTFADANSSVSVTVDNNGHLNIVSNRYGSASNVTVTSSSGTSATTFIGGGPTSTAGVDVAGTIGGLPATGSGQNLLGHPGSATEGLKLKIEGTTLGDRGTIEFSQGYAFKMDKFLDNYLGNTGLIAGRTTGLNTSINDIESQITSWNTRLDDIQKRYLAQFTALDTMISSLNATSSFLTQQLQQVTANSKQSS
jgi:flagellar hook-associated protein 2